MGFSRRSLGGKLLILCIFLAIAGDPRRALADDAASLPPTDVSTPISASAADPVHELITQQMDAIRARDADKAFSHTTASFHDHYSTAQNFLSHMRFEQRALYNHKNFTFLDRHEIESGGILQKVRVENSYGGDLATVIFRLQRQEDGRWLIDSFTLLDGGADARPI